MAEVQTVSQDVEPCVLHDSHSPITVVNERHHVFPLYLQERKFGEGNTPDQEKRAVCATGHSNVHAAITQFLKTGIYPDWCRGRTRDMAEEAIRRYLA